MSVNSEYNNNEGKNCINNTSILDNVCMCISSAGDMISKFEVSENGSNVVSEDMHDTILYKLDSLSGMLSQIGMQIELAKYKLSEMTIADIETDTNTHAHANANANYNIFVALVFYLKYIARGRLPCEK